MGLNETGPSVPKIQIFHPTLDEMKDFSAYIHKIEKMGANKAGLAKIIPPNEWKPRQAAYDTDDVMDIVISAPISQMVHGRQGLYQQYNIQKKSLTVREFKKLAESPKYKTPDHFDYEELERKYWKNVSYNSPIYGADVPGSLYDDNVDEFNINRLNTILDLVSESYGIKIMGVNTAYLYFGMWKTTFAWHTEDMDLYSINYLHFGAPKSWYSIPPEHGRRLERLAAGFFPSSNKLCPAFLRHKMTLISPQVLKQYSIPYCKITQEAGEFMITFPYAYHAGYNHGYNCAESTNFATERWVEYGKRATKCYCRSDSVKISMETFIKNFQPERYELWLQGKDIGPHPEDPSHISAAPAPSDYELAVLSKVSTNKSKRHPPYKPEYNNSDTGPYSVGESSSHSPVLTKAAKKLFDYPSQDSKDKFTDAYLQISPPNLKETVKKIRNRLVDKKYKKKNTSPSMKQVSKSRPTCTQPSSSTIIPLTWTATTLPSMNVSQILEKFLNSEDSTNEVNNCLQAQLSQTAHSSHTIDNTSANFGHPPPPLLDPYKLNQEPQPSFSSLLSSSSNVSRSQHLPSPPPLEQHSISTLATHTYKYPDHSLLSLNKSEYDHFNSESPLVFDDHCLQQSIELPSGSGRVEAGTSTEDLLDLLKLFRDGSSAANQILRCVPIPLYLYQYLPYNFLGEQLYNCAISSIFPHCAVCILLNKFEINPNWMDAQSTIPKSSQISIPGAAFAFKVTNPETTLDEVKFSPLLVCSDCKICVHTNCYGVVNVMPGEEKNWKCDRCKNSDYGISCILCPLRGGALKRTQDENKWVHITCALMQPGVSFQDGIYKSPIDITQIKKARGHGSFKCIYCQKSNNRLSDYVSGYCIQCYKAPKCFSKFHVTCAHINGAIFEASDWPDPIRVYCNKCTKNVEMTDTSANTTQEEEIAIGTSVIGKYKNNRYYDAIIIDKQSVTLYHVHFNDNSFTNRLRATDFVSHDVEQDWPEVGDPVVVLWNKETLTGKYSGSHQSVIYTLQFEDGSKIKSRRELFYLQDEKLPRKVQAKRSQATIVKNDALFWKQKFAQLRSPHN